MNHLTFRLLIIIMLIKQASRCCILHLEEECKLNPICYLLPCAKKYIVHRDMIQNAFPRLLGSTSESFWSNFHIIACLQDPKTINCQLKSNQQFKSMPEICQEKAYAWPSDIWSMGCVLYEMIMKVPPFRASTMRGLYNKVLAGKYDAIPQHYSLDLKKMISSIICT